MKKNFIFFLIIIGNSILFAQKLPLGYILQFEANFNESGMPEHLIFSDASNKRIVDGNLLLSEKNNSMDYFYPNSVVLVNNYIFGEYIVNMKIFPDFQDVDSSSSVFLIIGLKDSLNYYYVEINQENTKFWSLYKGKKTEHEINNAVYLENNHAVTLIVKRDILDRSITIQKNGDSVRFENPNLVMGYFGIGVENCLLRLDKLTIWAPTSIEAKAPVFYNSIEE